MHDQLQLVFHPSCTASTGPSPAAYIHSTNSLYVSTHNFTPFYLLLQPGSPFLRVSSQQNSQEELVNTVSSLLPLPFSLEFILTRFCFLSSYQTNFIQVPTDLHVGNSKSQSSIFILLDLSAAFVCSLLENYSSVYYWATKNVEQSLLFLTL